MVCLGPRALSAVVVRPLNFTVSCHTKRTRGIAMQSVQVAKVSAGTVYRLVGVESLCGFVLLGILFGVLGSMGLATVTWNRQPVTGLPALYTGPLIGLMIAMAITALVGSVIAFGLWLYAMVRPITIEFASLTDSDGG